jgi:hypothetical protein
VHYLPEPFPAGTAQDAMKPARSASAPQQVAENKAEFKIPAIVTRHPQPIGASPWVKVAAFSVIHRKMSGRI